jgi:hypothetical protein
VLSEQIEAMLVAAKIAATDHAGAHFLRLATAFRPQRVSRQPVAGSCLLKFLL